MMTQRANEALHRTQSELSVEQEAKSNQERACQTLTRRIVELEVRICIYLELLALISSVLGTFLECTFVRITPISSLAKSIQFQLLPFRANLKTWSNKQEMLESPRSLLCKTKLGSLKLIWIMRLRDVWTQRRFIINNK